MSYVLPSSTPTFPNPSIPFPLTHDFSQPQLTILPSPQTLGIRSAIPLPVTFFARVYLDYDADCKIQTIRAIAPSVPSEVLGAFVNFPSLGLPGLTALLLLLGFVPKLLCGLLC